MQGFESVALCEEVKAREQGLVAGRMIAETPGPDGAPWSQVFRTQCSYMLRFPGNADFDIAFDGGRIRAYPTPGLDSESLEHLYLNQAVPLALSRRGYGVFHGSAVEICGEAVAFLGTSGRGKSTLAAAFATHGSRFLADDGLVTERRGDSYWVLPSHPSIRLWDDSREAVLAGATPSAGSPRWNSKGRFLAGNGLSFCGDSRRLRAVYFLGEGTASAVSFARMSWRDAVLELVRNSFLLDAEERDPVMRHFEQTAMLAQSAECWQLDYPADLGALATVTAAIAQHAGKLGKPA